MQRMKSLLIPMVAATLLGACGDDDSSNEGPDVSGFYLVTRHTYGELTCDTQGGDATGLPYIRLTLEDFQGSTYYALRRCQSTDEADCDDLDFFHGTSFSLRIEGGWREIKSSAAYVGSECQLVYGEGTVESVDGGVWIELRQWSQNDPALPQSDCTPTVARDRASTMDCDFYEVIHGVPPTR